MRLAALLPLALFGMTGAAPAPMVDEVVSFDIAPSPEFPQHNAEGEHPQAWAKDLDLSRTHLPLRAVEITVIQHPEFYFAYDPLDTAGVGGHWVGWSRATNRLRLRDHTDGFLLAELAGSWADERREAPKGNGDVDFGDPPVSGTLTWNGPSQVTVTLTDREVLDRFMGAGAVPLRVVAWSDYVIESPASTFAYHAGVLCGARIEVKYLH